MKKFTLIEVLIVVAIIGILASLLLPLMKKARRTAKTVVCLSQLKQCGEANQLYLDDNSEWFPLSEVDQPVYNLLGTQGTYQYARGTDSQRPLNSYIGSVAIAQCPLDKENAFSNNEITAVWLGSTYMPSQWNSRINDLNGSGNGQVLGNVRNPVAMVFLTEFASYHMATLYNWNRANRPQAYFHNPKRPYFPFLFVDGHATHHMIIEGTGLEHSRDTIDFTNDP